MTPDEIRGALIAAGYTYAEVGRVSGVSRQWVRSVVYGCWSPLVMRNISTIIDRPIGAIWPQHKTKFARLEHYHNHAA